MKQTRCSHCGEWSHQDLHSSISEWKCPWCGKTQVQQIGQTQENLDMILEKIDTIVNDEVKFAIQKFGHFHSLHEGYAVLLEEVEEFWDSIKANNPDPKEIVQVCAMAKVILIDLYSLLAKRYMTIQQESPISDPRENI